MFFIQWHEFRDLFQFLIEFSRTNFADQSSPRPASCSSSGSSSGGRWNQLRPIAASQRRGNVGGKAKQSSARYEFSYHSSWPLNRHFTGCLKVLFPLKFILRKIMPWYKKKLLFSIEPRLYKDSKYKTLGFKQHALASDGGRVCALSNQRGKVWAKSAQLDTWRK